MNLPKTPEPMALTSCLSMAIFFYNGGINDLGVPKRDVRDYSSVKRLPPTLITGVPKLFVIPFTELPRFGVVNTVNPIMIICLCSLI